MLDGSSTRTVKVPPGKMVVAGRERKLGAWHLVGAQIVAH